MKDVIELVESPSFNYVRNKLRRSDSSVSMDRDSKGDFLAPLKRRSQQLHQLIKVNSMIDNGDLDKISEKSNSFTGSDMQSEKINENVQ